MANSYFWRVVRKRRNLELMSMKRLKKIILGLRDHWPFWVANSAKMKLKFRDKGQRYIKDDLTKKVVNLYFKNFNHDK